MNMYEGRRLNKNVIIIILMMNYLQNNDLLPDNYFGRKYENVKIDYQLTFI